MSFISRELLTSDEASEYTRLARQTIYDYVYRRQIPFYKIGGKLVFKAYELDRWIDMGGDKEASEQVIKERAGADNEYRIKNHIADRI